MHINYFRTYLKTASGRIKDMVEIRQKYQGKGAFEQADLKGYVATQLDFSDMGFSVHAAHLDSAEPVCAEKDIAPWLFVSLFGQLLECYIDEE
ncbi:hypothetical protein HO133_007168 [Letharia lupina]|uniref:Uncharacterized protein n=1 Tax=Letharia lupina TaxID=560253 RepID=A0A8H6FIA6_9LECA|nr:uncharacterized protein HO133_007168 [Letharia lupina]KAF6229054.1 hypothetical protein HO133_007168 [Letharia lupina]